LRGDIRDGKKKKTLTGLKYLCIQLGKPTFLAHMEFGITTQTLYITLNSNGYDQKIVQVKSTQGQNVLLHKTTFMKKWTYLFG
jgi:hypothetical protein